MLQSMGLQRVGHDLATGTTATSLCVKIKSSALEDAVVWVRVGAHSPPSQLENQGRELRDPIFRFCDSPIKSWCNAMSYRRGKDK